jgi:hypothetical protein
MTSKTIKKNPCNPQYSYWTDAETKLRDAAESIVAIIDSSDIARLLYDSDKKEILVPVMSIYNNLETFQKNIILEKIQELTKKRINIRVDADIRNFLEENVELFYETMYSLYEAKFNAILIDFFMDKFKRDKDQCEFFNHFHFRATNKDILSLNKAKREAAEKAAKEEKEKALIKKENVRDNVFIIDVFDFGEKEPEIFDKIQNNQTLSSSDIARLLNAALITKKYINDGIKYIPRPDQEENVGVLIDSRMSFGKKNRKNRKNRNKRSVIKKIQTKPKCVKMSRKKSRKNIQ